MKLKVFETLKKCMALTTSSNDPEALMALRAANRILASETLTWEKVLDRVVTVVNEFEAEDEPAPRTARRSTGGGGASARSDASPNEIRRLIAEAEAAQPNSKFVASVAEQFAEKNWLSEAQVETLRNIASRRRDW